MSVQNPIDLLPAELLEQLQEYVEGRVIYIPKKPSSKMHWGEKTDTKKVLAFRNSQICSDFRDGLDIRQLSEKYFLAEKSVQRILRQGKA